MEKKFKWDLERLLASADAFDVAKSIGMRINQCGKSTYIENVDGRQEKHIQHNQLFHDGCYDYTTGTGHNIYGMVKCYYENVLGCHLSHDEICEIIANTCGGPDSYRNKFDKEHKKSSAFPLTKEELGLIGLLPKNRYNYVVISYQEFKDEKHRKICDDGYVETAPAPSMNIYMLYRENPAMFWEMVIDKTSETIEKAKVGYLLFKEAINTNEFDAYLRRQMMKENSEKFKAAKSLKIKIMSLLTEKKIS